MDQIDGMRSFVAVVQAGSFTEAGKRLGLSTALVSKYVGQLEDNLGIRLLHRTTRRLSLTEEGRFYFEEAQKLLTDFDRLDEMINARQKQPSGTLVISAPTTFGEDILTEAILAFTQQHHQVKIDLRLSDDYVDIVDGGIDVAIRIGRLDDSSMIARKIASARVVVCASPDYLDREGTPQKPSDLAHHNCIMDSNFRGDGTWQFEEKGEITKHMMNGKITVNSARSVAKLVTSGAGIGRIPLYAIADAIQNDKAKIILEDYETADLGVFMLISHTQFLAPKTRSFLDFMLDYFRTKGT